MAPKAVLPKVIIRNKQIFEAIFTHLQLHPCYMINLLTKTGLNRSPKDVIRVVNAVYGDLSNDKRVLHTLMVVARRQLQSELIHHDIKEVLWGRTDSPFMRIFNLVFESQTANREYIRKLVCIMAHKLQKHEQARQDPEDDEAVRVQSLIEFTRNMIKHIVRSLRPQELKSASFSFLSDEAVTLLAYAREEVLSACGPSIDKQTLEDVDIYISTFVYDHLIRQLRSLDLSKLRADYWSALPEYKSKRPEPDITVFKGPTMQAFTNLLECYLKKKTLGLPESLRDFVNQGDLRSSIGQRLPENRLPMDLMLLRDLFINSLQVKDSTLTISIRELIEVYNMLLDKIDLI